MELVTELDQLRQQGRFEEAIEFANKHEDVLQNDFLAVWSVGVACFGIGRHTEAISRLEQACSLEHPHHYLALWVLGLVWSRLKDYESAESYLTRSVELKSGFLNRSALANVYLRTGRLEQAERIHLEGLEEKRTKQRLECYADFLFDTGRADEEAVILAEAETARIEGKASQRHRQSNDPDTDGAT